MSLDVLNPSIIKAINSIGGFCLVRDNSIDYKKYFPVDADKIGVLLPVVTWEYKGFGPSPGREMMSMTSYNDKLYMFGGFDGSDYLAEMWEYDPDTLTWTLLYNSSSETGDSGIAPCGRQGSGMVSYGSDLYIFGGSWDDSGYQYSDALWKFSTVSNTWIKVVDSGGPVGRQNHGLVIISDDIYVIGGVSGVSRETELGDMWSYNITSDTWTMRANTFVPVLSVSSARHSVVVYDSKIYVYGGRSVTAPSANAAHFEYDPATLAWTQLDDGPLALWGHSANVYGDKIFIFGGRTDTDTNSDKLYIYYPLTDTWSEGSLSPNTPDARFFHGSGIIDNFLYIYDGDLYDMKLYTYDVDPGLSGNDIVAAVKFARG